MEKLEWHAPEYIHTEKGKDWYWIVGIVSLSIAVIAIIFHNLIFGVLIIVSAFTLSLYASRPPRILCIEINKMGIRVGDAYYPFSTLHSFWVETRDAYPRLIVHSSKRFMPYIVILIEEIDPELIEHTLADYLPHEEHQQPFLEKLLIYLGF